MFSNTIFWILIFVCLFGYFLLRFGMISRGARKIEIEFIGGTAIFVSFLLVFILVGWKALLVEVGVFWIVITPIVEIIISNLQKRLHSVKEVETGSKPLSKTGKESLYDHLVETGQIKR